MGGMIFSRTAVCLAATLTFLASGMRAAGESAPPAEPAAKKERERKEPPPGGWPWQAWGYATLCAGDDVKSGFGGGGVELAWMSRDYRAGVFARLDHLDVEFRNHDFARAFRATSVGVGMRWHYAGVAFMHVLDESFEASGAAVVRLRQKTSLSAEAYVPFGERAHAFMLRAGFHAWEARACDGSGCRDSMLRASTFTFGYGYRFGARKER